MAQIDVSAQLESVRAFYNLPRVSELAMKDGRVVAQGAAGVHRMGFAGPLAVDDRIKLGSCGKWITAAVGHEMLAGYVSPLPSNVPDAALYLRQRAAYGPPGFASCTLREWARFVHVMMTGDIGNYLSASSWQKLTEPFFGTEGYALGIFAADRAGALPGQAPNHTGEY